MNKWRDDNFLSDTCTKYKLFESPEIEKKVGRINHVFLHIILHNYISVQIENEFAHY